jgi:hypothetical protein
MLLVSRWCWHNTPTTATAAAEFSADSVLLLLCVILVLHCEDGLVMLYASTVVCSAMSGRVGCMGRCSWVQPAEGIRVAVGVLLKLFVREGAQPLICTSIHVLVNITLTCNLRSLPVAEACSPKLDVAFRLPPAYVLNWSCHLGSCAVFSCCCCVLCLRLGFWMVAAGASESYMAGPTFLHRP